MITNNIVKAKEMITNIVLCFEDISIIKKNHEWNINEEKLLTRLIFQVKIKFVEIS